MVALQCLLRPTRLVVDSLEITLEINLGKAETQLYLQLNQLSFSSFPFLLHVRQCARLHPRGIALQGVRRCLSVVWLKIQVGLLWTVWYYNCQEVRGALCCELSSLEMHRKLSSTFPPVDHTCSQPTKLHIGLYWALKVRGKHVSFFLP